MKLLKIIGKPWEVTIFQDVYEPDEKHPFPKDFSISLVTDTNECLKFLRLRIYSDGKIRTKGKAWIEIRPMINECYWIYYDKKGFYCIIKGKKTYLNDLEHENVIYED